MNTTTKANTFSNDSIVLILLSEYRKALGLRQVDLLDLFGFNATNMVSKLESGKTHLRLSQFMEYCNAVNVTPSQVMADVTHIANGFVAVGWNQTVERDGRAILDTLCDLHRENKKVGFTDTKEFLCIKNAGIGTDEVYLHHMRLPIVIAEALGLQ